MAAVAAQATSPSLRPVRAPRTYRYGSFESRVAAAVLDLLVLFIFAALLVTAGALVVLISSDFERVDPSETSISVFWACVGAIPPVWLLYLFASMAWKGQTIGFSVMQLMVIRSDGKPLGPLGAIARIAGLLSYVVLLGFGAAGAYALRDSTLQAAAAVGAALVLVVLGLCWAAFDRHRRTLHDRIAGTIVVHIG